MQSNPSSPRSVVQCLISAFDVVAGRVKADDVFDYSAQGFWQAVLTNWVLGLILAALPLFALGGDFVILFMVISLVSILLYCLLVWHALVFMGRADRFTRFLVPYLWVGALQVVLFGLVTIAMQMTGLALLQILILPIAIWILIWLFRLARDQISTTAFAAVCFVVGRFAVELVIGLLAGVQTGIGLG